MHLNSWVSTLVITCATSLLTTKILVETLHFDMMIQVSHKNVYKHVLLDVRESPGTPAGIGQGRVTQNVRGAPVDYALLIKDAEAVEMVRGVIV